MTFEWNLDDLHDQPGMNYTGIHQFWIDQGYDENNLPGIYQGLFIILLIVSLLGLIGYWVMAQTRKNFSLKKQLGEEPLNYWEAFCEGTKLGSEPAINFVSSCLITNDRVFIIIRIVMALWSMTLTILGFAGVRSIIFGSYFPLATIITIYVSRHRHLIVEGFGKKMTFVNKVLSYFFALQAPLRIVLGVAWWTKWLGTSRYKDMRKSIPNGRAVLWMQEFLPCVFLLIEILWFDTRMSCISAYHATVTLCVVLVKIMNDSMSPAGTESPQVAVWLKENPGAAFIQFIQHIVLIPLCVFIIAGFCNLKLFVFKKVPVISERLEARQNCIEIFRKRHALNKFLPKDMLKRRKTEARESYATIGRQTQLRKTRMTRMQNPNKA